MIPTRENFQFAELENSAGLVMLTLRKLKRAQGNNWQRRDVDELARTLREQLRSFADEVIAMANGEPE